MFCEMCFITKSMQYVIIEQHKNSINIIDPVLMAVWYDNRQLLYILLIRIQDTDNMYTGQFS